MDAHAPGHVMSKTTPRYRDIAEHYRTMIETGELAPGAFLPTEMELCETHSVSRHTAREALRVLSEDGLIERRRRAGSRVKHQAERRFVQAIGGFEDLLQYAQTTRFEARRIAPASERLAKAFGFKEPCVAVEGRRLDSAGAVQALTTILTPSAFEPIKEALHAPTGVFSQWLEQERGVAIAQVRQTIQAATCSPAQARALDLEPGAAALMTTRIYSDAQGRIVLASRSIHPGDRFTYEMRIDRR